jgi:hypothetical protein
VPWSSNAFKCDYNFDSMSSNVRNKQFVKFLLNRRATRSGVSSITLVELQSNKSAQIAQSIFLQALVAENVVAYSPYFTTSNLRIFIYRNLAKIRIFSRDALPFSVYRAMGASQVIFVRKTTLKRSNRKEILEEFSRSTKDEILQFKFLGVRVGDLFYDWYLRVANKATIDVNDRFCQKMFLEFLSGVSYWNNFFQSANIDSLLITHSVYEQGVPARFAMTKNIPVFLVTSDRCFRLNEKDYLSDLEFKYYVPGVEEFNGYKIDLSAASKRMEALFSGRIGVDIAHSFVSGLHGIETDRIIRNATSVRVLIAAHCFSDSPHANGDHIFPDFIEWLNFLGDYSKLSKYEWYVKAHPAFFPSDIGIFREYCANNPHIVPIDSNYSNSELVQQGINVVLTVYGTIAFEAAYLGALVLDASVNTPHMNYDFTIKPADVSEYISALDNLENSLKEFKPSRNDILHFYDIHHLRKSEHWLFGDFYNDMVEFMGDYSSQYTDSRIYTFWMDLAEKTPHVEKVLTQISEFIADKRYVF